MTTLIDSSQKKVHILNEIIKKLSLSDQITAINKRIEEVSIEEKESYSVITARALSSLSSLIELASPLLIQQGRLICYKAKVEEKELDDALSIKNLVAMHLISRSQFYLSDGITYRELLVFEKNGTPEVELPRRIGKAQKNPYSNVSRETL